MVLHIKDFPDDLHKRLKVEAAINGVSLYQLIIDILTQHNEREAEK